MVNETNPGIGAEVGVSEQKSETSLFGDDTQPPFFAYLFYGAATKQRVARLGAAKMQSKQRGTLLFFFGFTFPRFFSALSRSSSARSQ